MNRKKLYASQEKARITCNKQRKRYYKKTQKYKPRSWTDEENEQVLAHMMTDHELSDLLCRSVEAIQAQRCKLKKRMRQT